MSVAGKSFGCKNAVVASPSLRKSLGCARRRNYVLLPTIYDDAAKNPQRVASCFQDPCVKYAA